MARLACAKYARWWSNEISLFFNPETGIDIDGAWNDMNEASNFVPNITMDPELVARLSNNPPEPKHPPRADTGREIPGFPEEFQPQSRPKVRTTRESPAKFDRVNVRRPAAQFTAGSQVESAATVHTRQEPRGAMKGLPDRDLLNPDYKISNHRGALSDSTILTNTSNLDGTTQYDTHNLYGTTMATATYNSMLERRPGKRPFVLTRSSFAGSGSKVAHWFGDNKSQWNDYRVQIPQLLTFTAVHQMPMVGSDICGFNANTTETMCARWAMLGAFMPFYRNHAVDGALPQEFYQWESVAEVARKAINTRYRLLDYIYTAMHRASTGGEPIAYPLFYLYPSDENTFGIDMQYFYGDTLMISPVIEDDANEVEFYMPDDIFYDFWTHEPVRGKGANVTAKDQALTDIPIHIRGGKILPLRTESANTTTQLRQKNFSLVVAPDLDGKAEGSLYLDDGESIDVGDEKSDIRFTWDGQILKSEGTYGFSTGLVIDHIIILDGENADKALTLEVSWRLDGPFEIKLPKEPSTRSSYDSV